MRFDHAALRTGIRVHFAEHGGASGAPVVFLHGWPDSWFSFSRVLALLPETVRAIALDQRGFEFQASTAYRPVPPEFFDRIVVESLKIPARLWPVMIDALVRYDATAKLGTLQVPTLLLWGDHDALFSRAEQDLFLSAVPRARLKVYEETGHCPNWERPDDVAADVASFILRGGT